MTSNSSASVGSSSTRSAVDADPITRNALRYTISAREYDLLHQYILSRTPGVRRRAPEPSKGRAAHSKDEAPDQNAVTIRLTVRAFLATYAGLSAYDVVAQRLLGRVAADSKRVAFWRSSNFRLSLSLSSILFFHRLLFRFFSRLRATLRSEDAKPFKRRNPRVWRALTSRVAPAVGASAAGLFLGLSPADGTRVAVAIYALSRALEFAFEAASNRGLLKSRPWWFGSWMIMPVACGQLLHAFVFDRDCFPAGYGSFILKRSPEYIQLRPADYPAGVAWPSTFDIVDSLGEISRLRWPAFVSPIIFPKVRTLPATLGRVAPLTDPAHPAIKRLSCAVLHPHDPSCSRTWLKYYIQAVPAMAKFWTLVYLAFSIPRYRAFIATPGTALHALAARVLRTTVYLTGAIGTAWSSICLLQRVLPAKALPTSRWFLSGFLAGLWAAVEGSSGRSGYLYSARTSIDSFWQVGRKRGWWRGVRDGDVLLFCCSLAAIDCLYERDPRAVNSGVLRKALGLFRGEGWVDRAAPAEAQHKEVEAAAEKKEA